MICGDKTFINKIIIILTQSRKKIKSKWRAGTTKYSQGKKHLHTPPPPHIHTHAHTHTHTHTETHIITHMIIENKVNKNVLKVTNNNNWKTQRFCYKTWGRRIKHLSWNLVTTSDIRILKKYYKTKNNNAVQLCYYTKVCKHNKCKY